MGRRGCHLFIIIVVTSVCEQWKVLADQDHFKKVDGTEKFLPLFEGDAPDDFCMKPVIPLNGELLCGKLESNTRRYACIAECDLGFEFPNKEMKGKILCDLVTGEWLTTHEFPDCVEQIICDPPCRNGGTCQREGVCVCRENFTGDHCEKRICTPPCQNEGTCMVKNTCSCAPRFEGHRCEVDICRMPPKPLRAKMRCSPIITDPNRYDCIAECEEGYSFPNGEKKTKHVCDARTKKWNPQHEFPDCEAKCEPPCENGGICEKGNECICTPHFEGDRCEEAVGCVSGWTQYLNTDNPNFSDIGDDESLDRLSEMEPFCFGGVIKDIDCKAVLKGKLVDYTEVGTAGLECSKDTGFVCNRDARKKECEDFAVRFLCGCDVCNPPCENGGICAEENICVCPPDFEGDRCEIAKPPANCVEGWTQYFNTDSPDHSDIGDDETLERIGEFEPVCSGGVIKDIECKAVMNGNLVDYEEVGTSGLECSKETGFICNEDVRQMRCEDFTVRFRCECSKEMI